jgi:hypothetical protein
MLCCSYTKNKVSTLNDTPVGKELLSAASSIAVLPEAETHLLPAASAGSHTPRERAQEIPSPIRTNQSPPLEVYTAYAHDDKRFFKKIKAQLNILQRQRWPISCHESEIIYSTAWQSSNHLTTANLILLLVSTAFLNSDFCYCDQMFLAVERHRTEKLCCVIPIILHPLHHLLLERTPFGNLDFLPTKGKALSTWKDPRKAYTDITGYLIEKIQSMAYYL